MLIDHTWLFLKLLINSCMAAALACVFITCMTYAFDIKLEWHIPCMISSALTTLIVNMKPEKDGTWFNLTYVYKLQ